MKESLLNGSWEWRPLGMGAPRNGGPWEWRPLGMAAPNLFILKASLASLRYCPIQLFVVLFQFPSDFSCQPAKLSRDCSHST